MRPLVTRLAYTGIVQVTTNACFSRRTFAVVRPNPVVARAPVVAEPVGGLAVVDVDAAVVARPTVDAHADEATALVVTTASVLTRCVAQRAFVHVHGAQRSRPFGRTLARVALDQVDARCVVGALVACTVVDVSLTVTSPKSS